jgi:phosphopantetheine adenylyltransferase
MLTPAIRRARSVPIVTNSRDVIQALIIIQIKNGTSESKEALLFVNKKKQKNFDILVRGLRPMAGYDPN